MWFYQTLQDVHIDKLESHTNSGLVVLGSDLVVEASALKSTRYDNESGESLSDNDGAQQQVDFSDLEQLQVVRLEGVDRLRRRIIRIVGKFLPAPVVDSKRLQGYIECKLGQEIHEEKVSIVYFHTTVQRGENSPGMLTLRRIYEELPFSFKQRLESIYIVHPGLRSRVLLATLGRFFLSEGFYSKVTYVNRVEFLWDYLKKGQVEVPEFVLEHDAELEKRPLMDYGFEGDPHQFMDGSGVGPVSRIASRSNVY